MSTLQQIVELAHFRGDICNIKKQVKEDKIVKGKIQIFLALMVVYEL